MSPRRVFDRFMIENELGSNGKVGRLNDAEFRCMVTGVWALASKAAPRGYLVVAGEPATPEDVARQAHKPVSVARRTLTLMRSMQMIETDPELGVEFCHEWWDINPDPKPDPTNAERQRRWKAKRKALRNGAGNASGNGRVTEPVTASVTVLKQHGNADEVEEEGKALTETYLAKAQGRWPS